jgi:hypothetical protein
MSENPDNPDSIPSWAHSLFIRMRMIEESHQSISKQIYELQEARTNHFNRIQFIDANCLAMSETNEKIEQQHQLLLDYYHQTATDIEFLHQRFSTAPSNNNSSNLFTHNIPPFNQMPNINKSFLSPTSPSFLPQSPITSTKKTSTSAHTQQRPPQPNFSQPSTYAQAASSKSSANNNSKNNNQPPSFIQTLRSTTNKQEKIHQLLRPDPATAPPKATSISSFIIRAPLSRNAMTSPIPSVKALIYTLTDHNPLGISVLSNQSFEIFVPSDQLPTITSAIESSHNAGCQIQLLSSPHTLTQEDVPRRAATYNRSRFSLLRRSCLSSFSHDLQLAVLAHAETRIAQLPIQFQHSAQLAITNDRNWLTHTPDRSK